MSLRPASQVAVRQINQPIKQLHLSSTMAGCVQGDHVSSFGEADDPSQKLGPETGHPISLAGWNWRNSCLNLISGLQGTHPEAGSVEVDGVDRVARAVVAPRGRAVLHAVVPVPDVLEPVHLPPCTWLLSC